MGAPYRDRPFAICALSTAGRATVTACCLLCAQHSRPSPTVFEPDDSARQDSRVLPQCMSCTCDPSAHPKRHFWLLNATRRIFRLLGLFFLAHAHFSNWPDQGAD